MRNSLTILCLMVSTASFAQVAPAAGADQQRQSLLSRLRGEPAANTAQQVQREPVQIAQPAATGAYRPGVTYPQQQQRQTQQQPQAQQPVARTPGFPPQQTPYNIPQQQPGQVPAATPAARSGQSSSDNNDEDKNTRSSTRNNDSDNDSKKSSSAKSSDSNKSSSRSSKSSDDSDKKSSSASRDKNSEKESSSKSSSSSALEKIVKNVESGKSETKTETAKKEQPKEKAEPVKKSEEEIAAEKAHAIALKAADEATTVVAGFLKQANDGYYSKASESLAPAIQKYFESEISAVNGPQKTVLDELTANGTINMVTYINTTVRGEGAVVEAELGYGDGHSTRRSFDLIKIKDDWKIVLPVKEDASAPRSSQKSATPVAQSTPVPALAPPTAEQAATRVPLVMAPGSTNPQNSETSAPVE